MDKKVDMEKIDPIYILPEETQIGDSLSDLPHDLQETIFDSPDALSYQFIITCKPVVEKISPPIGEENARKSLVDLRKTYLSSLNERISELDGWRP